MFGLEQNLELEQFVDSGSNSGKETLSLCFPCDGCLPQLTNLRLQLLNVLHRLVVGRLEPVLIILLTDGILPPELLDL